MHGSPQALALSAAYLPPLTLLFDLLAVLQGEGVWFAIGVVVLLAAVAANLGNLRLSEDRAAYLAACSLMAFSLGLRVAQPLAGSVSLGLASALLSLGVLVMLWRGTTLDRMRVRRQSLLTLLDEAEAHKDTVASRHGLRRAS